LNSRLPDKEKKKKKKKKKKEKKGGDYGHTLMGSPPWLVP
jgi:hypothetical protein